VPVDGERTAPHVPRAQGTCVTRHHDADAGGREAAVHGRILFAAVVALGATVGLSACSSPVRAADLVGTYRDGDGLRPLVLRADGGCAAHLLPTASSVVTGACRWSVREHDGPEVRLDFHRDARAGAYFVIYRVDGTGPGATLFRINDPDLQHRYELRR
jgi:hypothetical protein